MAVVMKMSMPPNHGLEPSDLDDVAEALALELLFSTAAACISVWFGSGWWWWGRCEK